MQNLDCYQYGLKLKSYLDGLNKPEIHTSFENIMKNVGLPDNAIGRIALYSVPQYRTDYIAELGRVDFFKQR